MSNVSIFQKSWTDIVFEGRNKSYGAYQLRNENPRTTLTALFLGLTSLIAIGGILFLVQGIKDDVVITAPVFDDPIVVTTYNYQPPPPQQPAGNSLPVEKETENNDEKDLVDPEIVSTDQAEDVRTNQETRDNVPPTSGESENTNQNTGATGGGNTGTQTTTIPAPPAGPEIVPTYRLDRLPEFPGGINKFYKYIGNNFERTDVGNSGAKTVLLSFVIERDGTMTDIKVIRSAGPEIDREALRVLKSLKTKWSAGLKDGEKVRTLYTLPITVNEMQD